jgi:tetratricopeptide (TPR) repeat protein
MRVLVYFLLFLSTTFTKSFAQTKLEKAEDFFLRKHDVIENKKASSKNIDKAIALFTQIDQEPERTIGLLKSYEFKASWTNVTAEEKRLLYEKAIELAKEKSQEFPKNGAIAYWHAANYARRANLLDITEAAQEGVLDEIKELAEIAIQLDQEYNQAGGLRLLGGLHMEAPSIPLILSWPSNETALKLLEKAYHIAPQHCANVYLYGKILYVLGKEREAEKIFKDLISRKARQEYLLVDQKYIQKGKEYYDEHY